LRRLEDADSMEYLTDLLHRAFSRIGAMGIPCSCVNQSPEVTRQRISRGDCFVALSGDLIVGTITLYPPDAASDSKHYRNDSVGTLRQLAVDPLFHGRGIGSALLRLAENWALHRGYLWLALDTPEPADHLINYYRRQGFGIKETLQFSGRPYRSVVFSKSVADRKIANRRPHALGGPPFITPIQCAQRQMAMRSHSNSHFLRSPRARVTRAGDSRRNDSLRRCKSRTNKSLIFPLR
jgi:GNAT superfamily N-acetyltransferase